MVLFTIRTYGNGDEDFFMVKKFTTKNQGDKNMTLFKMRISKHRNCVEIATNCI